jgi:hypothetical protein
VVVCVIRATRPSRPSRIAPTTIPIAAFSKFPLYVEAIEWNPANREPDVMRLGRT